MIHKISCKIVSPIGIGVLTKPEPPLPSPEQIAEVFGPEWKERAKLFVARVAKEQGKDTLTNGDFFTYGLQFAICEATKML
jgi:hypothetical protein